MPNFSVMKRLRAFSGAGRAQKYQSHDRLVSGDFVHSCRFARAASGRPSSAAHALQVLGVSTPGAASARDRHGDAVAVPQRAQLLQRLERSSGAGASADTPRKRDAVGVDADVAVARQSGGACATARRRRAHRESARARNRAHAARVEHDLHHVGIEECRRLAIGWRAVAIAASAWRASSGHRANQLADRSAARRPARSRRSSSSP